MEVEDMPWDAEGDVEMMDVSELAESSGPAEARGDYGQLYIALDTNILISHLTTVQSIYSTLLNRQQSLTGSKPSDVAPFNKLEVGLLIPNTVIRELDKQKNFRQTPSAAKSPDSRSTSIHEPSHASLVGSTGQRFSELGIKARAATSWLLDIGRQAREEVAGGMGEKAGLGALMRLQKMGELCDQARVLTKADDRILDCCLYFAQQPNQVVLWTNDKNLALQAETHAIPAFGNGSFSPSSVLSRVIGLATGQSGTRTNLLDSGYPCEPSIGRGLRSIGLGVDAKADEDGMMLDEEFASSRSAHAASAGSLPTKAPPPHVAKVQQKPNEPQPEHDRGDGIPTFRSLSTSVSAILSIPLYSLLLTRVAQDDPPTLRRLIGRDDPGPGHWSLGHVLRLMERFWDGTIGVNSGGLEVGSGIGVFWAREREVIKANANANGRKEQARGSRASRFAPPTIVIPLAIPSSGTMPKAKDARHLTRTEKTRMDDAHAALHGLVEWERYYSADERYLDMRPLGPNTTNATNDTDNANITNIYDDDDDDAMMMMDNDDMDSMTDMHEQEDFDMRRAMGEDWKRAAGMMRTLFLDVDWEAGDENGWWLEGRAMRELEEIVRRMGEIEV